MNKARFTLGSVLCSLRRACALDDRREAGLQYSYGSLMGPVAGPSWLLFLRPLQELLKQTFLLDRIAGSGVPCLCQCTVDVGRHRRQLGRIAIEPLLGRGKALPAANRRCHVDVAPGGMAGGLRNSLALLKNASTNFSIRL